MWEQSPEEVLEFLSLKIFPTFHSKFMPEKGERSFFPSPYSEGSTLHCFSGDSHSQIHRIPGSLRLGKTSRIIESKLFPIPALPPSLLPGLERLSGKGRRNFSMEGAAQLGLGSPSQEHWGWSKSCWGLMILELFSNPKSTLERSWVRGLTPRFSLSWDMEIRFKLGLSLWGSPRNRNSFGLGRASWWLQSLSAALFKGHHANVPSWAHFRSLT